MSLQFFKWWWRLADRCTLVTHETLLFQSFMIPSALILAIVNNRKIIALSNRSDPVCGALLQQGFSNL